jgi:hypothetical protein
MNTGNDVGIFGLCDIGTGVEKLVFPMGDDKRGIAMTDERNFCNS